MNNPPAFPQIPTGQTTSTGPQFGCDVHSNYEGMTLRDYFAGMALQGQIANNEYTCNQKQMAFLAYVQADAMLAERDKAITHDQLTTIATKLARALRNVELGKPGAAEGAEEALREFDEVMGGIKQ